MPDQPTPDAAPPETREETVEPDADVAEELPAEAGDPNGQPV